MENIYDSIKRWEEKERQDTLNAIARRESQTADYLIFIDEFKETNPEISAEFLGHKKRAEEEIKRFKERLAEKRI